MRSPSQNHALARLAATALLGCAGEPLRAVASPLLGNAVSNTPESPISALINPAQAGLVTHYEINVSASAWDESYSSMEVPGAAPLKKSSGGPGFGNAMLGLPILGPCGAAVLGVPPKIIKGDLQREVPLYVMNQLNTVVVKGSGEFLGMLDLALGCRVGPRAAVGLAARYDGLSYTASVITPRNDTELVQVSGSQKSTTFVLGGRIVVGAFLFAGVVELLSRSESRQHVTAPMLANASMNSASDGLNYFNKFRLGTGYRGGHFGSLFLEGEYKPAGDARESFSSAEFRKKPVDAHSTLSFHSGYKLPIGFRHSLLLGFEYLPASLGSGGRGDGTTTGFTALNGSLMYAGLESLKPRWTLAGGLEMIFGGAMSKEDRSVTVHTRLGIAYGQAEFSTGDDGEQPAVYQQSRFGIPLEVQVKF